MAIISVGQFSIVDANDGLSAQLTSNSVVLPSDKDGNVNSYASAETRFTIFEAGVDMSVRWGFYVSATGGGITYRDVNDTADRSDAGPTNGVLDSNYLRVTGLTQATSYIDITATRAGQQAIVRRYSVTRANTGATGTRGTMTVSRAISGASWVDSEAVTAISGSGGGSPLRGDTVTLYRTSPAFSETRVFNGTGWVTQAAYLAGSQIIDGSVNGNKITAGTIVGDRIAANTINTTKLAIADFTNYATNGDLTLGQVGWAGVTVSSDATNAYMGSTVITLPAGSTVNKYASNENVFSVKPGDSFYLEWWGKATSDMDSNFNVYVRVNNASGGQIQSSGVGAIDKSNTAYVMRSGTITMPANAYSAYIQINWNNTIGTGYIGAVRMRRRNEGALIVDGTITGNKVAANTLTGDNIQANTIAAKSLLIGDTTNYAENADFGLGNVGWIIQQNSGAAATIVQAAGDSYQSGWITNVAANSNGGIRNKANMRVKAGDKLLGYVIAKGGGGTLNAYPRISYLRADGSELQVEGGASFVANGSYQTITVNGTVPSGAVYARVECFWSTAANTFFYVGAAGLMRRMTGDLIVDGAITAEKVDAKAIQGKHIAGETITGDKLEVGTITAAQLGAGAVVASKLAVGNTDSVVTDATYQDLGWWNGTTDGAAYANTELFDTSSGWNLFRRAFRIKPGAFAFRTPFFPVEPGATYKVRVQTYVGDIDSQNSWFNPTIHMPNVAWYSLKDGRAYDNSDPSIRGPNSWTQRNVSTGNVPSSEFIVNNPAAQNVAQWQFRFDGNLANDYVEIAISVVRVSDATLIADGAITTSKITVNSLDGDRIKVDTLDASKIKANTVLSNLVTVKDTSGNIGDAILRASDPAKRINEFTTQLDPGRITIQGSASLNDWRDQTFIKGGAIKANSVTADKMNINARGINTEGIDFEVKTVSGGPELTWNGGGYIQYMGDDGNGQSRQIASGSTYGVSKRCFVYWIMGENSFRVTTSAESVMVNQNAVMIGTYMGGTTFNVYYGGTVINGSRITTGSINADTLAVGAINANSISLGTSTEGLLANGGAETGNTEGWTGQGFVLSGGNGSQFNHGQSPNSGGGYYSKAFPVTAGRTYTAAWDLYGSNAYFRVMWSDSKPAFNVNTQNFTDLLANGGGGNFWQSYTGGWTAPSSAKWVSVVLYNVGGSNNIYWDNLQFFEQVTGIRIKDGTITANKVAVNQLSALSANIGDVTAGTIRNANGSTNFDVTNGRITFDNGSVMRVMGNGFGSSNQFIEWFGPKQSSLANCTEANATQYLKTNGSAYFGGTLSGGVTKNAVNTTSIATNAAVTTGQVGSRGGSRVVVVGYSWNQFVTVNKNQQPSSGGGLSARVVLQRNGQDVMTLDATGTWDRTAAFSDNEPGSYSENIGGSITFTDNSGGDKVTYTAYLVSRTLGPGAQNGTNREPQYTQRIDIVQTEQ